MATTADIYNDTATTELGHDRLGFMFCLALALHAAIILGVTFNHEDRTLAAPKLEITLAQHRSANAPDEADFLAQSNQLGSGTLEEKALLTSKELADFQDTQIHEVAKQQQRSQSQAQQAINTQLSSTRSNQQIQALIEQDFEQQQDQAATHELTIEQRNREIASLQAKLDIQEYAYAKRPRIHRLTSVAAKQSDDAIYLHNWRAKVESIGNQHYPSQAKNQQLYGDLRMVVSLLPNGDVHRVKILKSSGHKILDQAAMKIVHLAAPYDPFPTKMQNSVDVLEIIRTWRFHKDRLSSSI